MATTDPERVPVTPPPAREDSGALASRDAGTDIVRASREPRGAWLGGVCTGLAQHLHCPVMVLRIGFVALAAVQFIGLVIYAVLWIALPAAAPVEIAPGLEAAERQNMRTVDKKRRARDVGVVLAFGMLATGLLMLAYTSGLTLSGRVFWPVAFACSGLALVWRTADTVDDRADRPYDGPRWLEPFVARGRLLTIARVVLGMGLVGAAVSLVIASQSGIQMLPQTFAMTGLALTGVALVVAPWVHRSRQTLQRAREDKVRADERADMAAHLHDSVLQTLALIQRQANDPKAVATLARRQERELRTWLYGDVIKETTLKAALTAAAAEVEDERGTPVEVVCVGDTVMDEGVEAAVRAAREAMVNAAKHSGAARIDVYAEADDEGLEIFVRDRGRGFDLDAIEHDRMGVRGSILARMERHGGKARVRSAPGEGTEVRLEMKR